MDHSPQIQNYLAHDVPGLEPGRLKLVFRAGFDGGGPGRSEEWVLRLGPDTEGVWDVLWLKSDWDEAPTPVAWIVRGSLRGKALAAALVKAWLTALRDHEDAEGPPYEDVHASKTAMLRRRDLSRIESAVWPETEEPDEA